MSWHAMAPYCVCVIRRYDWSFLNYSSCNECFILTCWQRKVVTVREIHGMCNWPWECTSRTLSSLGSSSGTRTLCHPRRRSLCHRARGHQRVLLLGHQRQAAPVAIDMRHIPIPGNFRPFRSRRQAGGGRRHQHQKGRKETFSLCY